MYLYQEHYIGANYKHRNITGTVDIKKDGKPIKIDFNRISAITENVGYWRKANHIHAWFVRNCQDGEDDCRRAYVSIDDLEKLLKDCEAVRDNHDLAAELLPTQNGFFFGGTEYDEYYFRDIDDTIAIVKPILDEDSAAEYYYTSSW